MSDQLIDVGSLTIEATLTKVMWHQNGTLIGKVNVKPGQDIPSPGKYPVRQMSVIGPMHNPAVGTTYKFVSASGVTWNPRFSTCECRFETYTTVLPDTSVGAIEYLSQICKGIGYSTASAIVEMFGPDAIAKLKSDPEDVALKVKRLDSATAKQAAEDLKSNEAIEHATIELNQMLSGILHPSASRKAIKRWGADAPHVIKEDPFALTQLRGIGFHSADVVHQRLGLDPQSPNRHVAAIRHVLNECAARDGSTLMTVNDLVMKATALVSTLHPEATNLATADDAIAQLYATPGGEHDNIQLTNLADEEHRIAAHLVSAVHAPLVQQIKPLGFDDLAPEQRTAAEEALASNVFILCGAPGTGKTFTMARIMAAMRGAGMDFALCAPTGKAAKQMTLALSSTGGGTADTIHSTLKAMYDEETETFGFEHCASNPIEADVVIADEFSMVPVALCDSLFSALRTTTRLLIIGDHYQLPSVGPGAVLRDMLAAGIPHYELREIRRNAGDIVRACHSIKDGIVPTLPTDRLDLDAGHNWRHIPASTNQVSPIIQQLYEGKLRAMNPDIDLTWDAQVISPTNEKGTHSCKALNELVKSILNPANKHKWLPFSVQDKVVRLKNGKAPGYVKNQATGKLERAGEVRIVNGDIGIVQEITDKNVVVKFLYPERVVELPIKEHELRQAYCMTCHKMQGSEVPIVILPLTRAITGIPLVTREWVYTAFSRAKAALITIGDLSVLPTAINRIGTQNRNTTLASRIESCLQAPARTINQRNGRVA